ncbi:hypothetical protein BDN70DRAFT_996921 [Pholiota conissans]|uniref:F-box domain-containing protein n=1 Tax=Pholiota conissans TaxID=109636 RepID=A0A9P5YSD9_9AGAR|nr:hypothetical protein BDN70DRAFT_996921 [Pholiota conissans]
MHRALTNGVIISEVARQLGQDGEPDAEMRELGLVVAPVVAPSSARTLYALALTCRSFARHALDALWVALDDLTPLFKVIPGFRGKYFDRVLTGSELARFEKYANRVRLYRCRGKERIGLSAYIQVMQSRETFGRTLLPRLMYLSTAISCPELQYLIGGPLVALCCSPPVTDTIPFDILALIHSSAVSRKTLRYLKLNLSLPDACQRSITQLSNLKFLAIHNSTNKPMSLDAQFFQAISKFKYLSKILLSGPLYLATENLSSSNQTVFPALTDFWISTQPNEVTRLISLLDIGKFEHLDTLWLSFPPVPDDGWRDIVTIPWIQFFKILRMRTSSRWFKSLVIECSYVDLEKPIAEWPALALSDLPDFFLLKLARLRIAFPIFPIISNADIYKIISSFPSLVSLEIVTRLPWQTDFTAIIAIAKGLPCLRELTMGIDAHAMPPDFLVPMLSHNLFGLKLIVSRLRDPGQFAFYLDRMFHELQTLELLGCGEDSEGPIQREALNEVRRALMRFNSARADQTRRLSLSSRSREGSFSVMR